MTFERATIGERDGAASMTAVVARLRESFSLRERLSLRGRLPLLRGLLLLSRP